MEALLAATTTPPKASSISNVLTKLQRAVDSEDSIGPDEATQTLFDKLKNAVCKLEVASQLVEAVEPQGGEPAICASISGALACFQDTSTQTPIHPAARHPDIPNPEIQTPGVQGLDAQTWEVKAGRSRIQQSRIQKFRIQHPRDLPARPSWAVAWARRPPSPLFSVS